MSSRIKRWSARGALALPIVMSVGLSLWFTRPIAAPPRSVAAAAEIDAAEPLESVAAANLADPAASSATTSTTSTEDLETRMRRRRIEALESQPATKATENELAEAILREYAPNMWKRVVNMRDVPMRGRVERQLLERARDLQRMRVRDEEQFKREIEQLKLEDEVADLGRRAARQGENSLEADALRKAIERLVDTRIQNREARLARLEKTLAAEKEKLAADRDNRSKLVDRQFQAVVTNRRPIGGVGGPPREERPGFAAPDGGPRRGPNAPRLRGNEPNTVQASPDRRSDSDVTSDSNDKSK